MIDSALVISQIQDYVFENHPDLLDADNVIIFMCLFSQWQQAYEGYLASHVLTYEASAQAFSDIFFVKFRLCAIEGICQRQHGRFVCNRRVSH